MDLAVPLKEKRATPDQARWMLRTIYHHLAVDRIYLIGALPRWADPTMVTHIPTDQSASKFTNIGTNLRAVLDSDISEDFYWTNDDIFLLTDLPAIPLLNRGTIEPYVSGLADGPTQDQADFTRGMRAQSAIAQVWGYDPATTWNCDLHTPIPLNRTRLKDILDRRDTTGIEIEDGHFRLLYGLGESSFGVKDPKVVNDVLPSLDWAMVSTSPSSWENKTGDYVRNRYWRPSPWEKTR